MFLSAPLSADNPEEEPSTRISVSGFLLSPGITPALTDAFVVELPLAVGLGYLLGRRSGFELAFAVNAVVLGVVKLVTDYFDPLDAIIALLAVAGGLAWLSQLTGSPWTPRRKRLSFSALGAGCVLAGIIKLRDFYDPFDILLADSVLVSGIALWAYLRSDTALRKVGDAKSQLSRGEQARG